MLVSKEKIVVKLQEVVLKHHMQKLLTERAPRKVACSKDSIVVLTFVLVELRAKGASSFCDFFFKLPLAISLHFTLS